MTLHNNSINITEKVIEKFICEKFVTGKSDLNNLCLHSTFRLLLIK